MLVSLTFWQPLYILASLCLEFSPVLSSLTEDMVLQNCIFDTPLGSQNWDRDTVCKTSLHSSSQPYLFRRQNQVFTVEVWEDGWIGYLAVSCFNSVWQFLHSVLDAKFKSLQTGLQIEQDKSVSAGDTTNKGQGQHLPCPIPWLAFSRYTFSSEWR
mgnify:CR=1 FL=1